MQTQLDIGLDKKIAIGDKCLITEKGSRNGYGYSNTLLNVWGFKVNKDGKTLIGLHSPIYNKDWSGNLDGNVPRGHGIWINVSNFINNIFHIEKKYEIYRNFRFGNKNLRGMQCKMLYKYNNGTVFVEVDRDIGGSSCDGLGKTGHCVILPYDIIKKVK